MRAGLTAVVLLALLALALHGAPADLGPQLLSALRRGDLRLVALGAALNLLINTPASVARWQSLLPAGAASPPSFQALLRVTCQALLLNNVLPARPGEALRIRLLHRHGVRAGAIAQVLLTEKVLEALSLGLVCAAGLWWWPSSMAWLSAGPVGLAAGPVGRPGLVAGLVGLVGLAGLAGLAVILIRGPLRRRLRLRGLSATGLGATGLGATGLSATGLGATGGRRLLVALGWALVCDLADVAQLSLCLRAVGIPGEWAGGCYLGLNLALLLPSPPGHAGTLEAGLVLTLGLLGVAPQQALASALLYHLAHWGPTTAAGAAAFVLSQRR